MKVYLRIPSGEACFCVSSFPFPSHPNGPPQQPHPSVPLPFSFLSQFVPQFEWRDKRTNLSRITVWDETRLSKNNLLPIAVFQTDDPILVSQCPSLPNNPVVKASETNATVRHSFCTIQILFYCVTCWDNGCDRLGFDSRLLHFM